MIEMSMTNIQQNVNNPFELSGAMQEIYKTKDGVSVMGAWSRDVSTKERKLMISLVYPDGERSPIHEYAPSKITAKGLSDLGDLDGLSPEIIPELCKMIQQMKDTLPMQNGGSGTCSIMQAYYALCNYVQTYEQPGEVFVSDGYGNILAKNLQSVLERVVPGYRRLTVEKNFKAWQLLRVGEASGHPYDYPIKKGGTLRWYFSFKLPVQEDAVQGEENKEVA